MKKKLALILSVVMVFGITVGATFAWLMDTTKTVTNTFTVGKVEITLNEEDVDGDSNTDDNVLIKDSEGNAVGTRDLANKYDIIPGTTYKKDPIVTVLGGSEKCYLFVKFDEVGNPSTYYTYTSLLTTDNDWTEIETGVWYKVVNASDADQPFHLLANDQITIKDTVEQDDMTAAGAASLSWTAYAVQFDNRSPQQAWALVDPTPATTTE